MSKVKNRALLHFVWTTSQRMPWIKPEIALSVHRYLETVARNDGCEVLAVGGMPDHIHLFVCMSTTVSLARLMQHLKGGSSHLIQHDLLPGSFFQWQEGYAIFGVSPSPKPVSSPTSKTRRSTTETDPSGQKQNPVRRIQMSRSKACPL